MPIKQLGAVILAGGRASRLDYADKPLLLLNGKEIIRYVIDKASCDASTILISVNRNLEKFRKFELPLIDDSPHQSNGPLVGIYSAMRWFKTQAPAINYLACFPADVPLFPDHIAHRLLTTLQADGNLIAWCRSRDQLQPLFSVWSMDIFPQLELAIHQGAYGPRHFIPQHPNSLLLLEDLAIGDFFNINTWAELAQAEKLAAANSSGKVP